MSAQLPAQKTIPILFPLQQSKLRGWLVLPEALRGLIIFVNTCTSSPMSCTTETGTGTEPEREQALETPQENLPGPAIPEETESSEMIAARLHQHGFGTLHIDLMQDRECRFPDAGRNLPLLQERLLAVVSHLRRQIAMAAVPDVPIGLFASDIGTPLAIRVAAQRDHDIRALVCHGGLVDLAGRIYLRLLQAPLLLITDHHDTAAQTNAERARSHIPGICEFSQLADEAPAARQAQLADLAVDWFQKRLGGWAGMSDSSDEAYTAPV